MIIKCGIYRITNKINGKIYIGSSVNISKRITNHKYTLKANLHCNKHLQDSYNKYGKNNFLYDIVEECVVDSLIDRENYYITFYGANDKNKGYNMATVNEFRRNTFNEELKVKQSILNLKINGNFIKFKSINVLTGEEKEFESLVDAANFLREKGFLVGGSHWAKMKISNHLRGIWEVKDEHRIKSRPKKLRVSYNHHWEIIQ